MSLCILRSSSPIHVQYLKNMGVRATLVVSLVIGDRLWGLIACHHYEPRFVHFEERAVCEVLAEAVATRIAALESFARGQAELAVRRLEQRMIEAIAREGDWRGALFDRSQALLQPLGATGAALLFDGQILTTGDVPGIDRPARHRHLARRRAPQGRARGQHRLARPRRAGVRAADGGRQRPRRRRGVGDAVANT